MPYPCPCPCWPLWLPVWLPPYELLPAAGTLASAWLDSRPGKAASSRLLAAPSKHKLELRAAASCKLEAVKAFSSSRNSPRPYSPSRES